MVFVTAAGGKTRLIINFSGNNIIGINLNISSYKEFL